MNQPTPKTCQAGHDLGPTLVAVDNAYIYAATLEGEALLGELACATNALTGNLPPEFRGTQFSLAANLIALMASRLVTQVDEAPVIDLEDGTTLTIKPAAIATPASCRCEEDVNIASVVNTYVDAQLEHARKHRTAEAPPLGACL